MPVLEYDWGQFFCRHPNNSRLFHFHFTTLETVENGQMLFDFSHIDVFLYTTIGMDEKLTAKLMIESRILCKFDPSVLSCRFAIPAAAG